LKSALGIVRSHTLVGTVLYARQGFGRGDAMLKEYLREREQECAFIHVRSSHTGESQCPNQYASKPASNCPSRLLILAKDSIQTLPSSLVTLAEG
jgi:hypothetical protein